MVHRKGRKPRRRPERLGEKLRRIRSRLGESQNGMLRRLGIADEFRREDWSNFESNKREPPSVVLLLTARLMAGVTAISAGGWLESLLDDDMELPHTMEPER